MYVYIYIYIFFFYNFFLQFKKVNEDDTKTKANTISAHTSLCDYLSKSPKFGDFGHVFLYYS